MDNQPSDSITRWVMREEQLMGEIDRLHALIRRGLAYGDQFRTPYAAGARAELRASAGMEIRARQTDRRTADRRMK